MDLEEAYEIVRTWANIGFGEDGDYTVNIKDYHEALSTVDNFINAHNRGER